MCLVKYTYKYLYQGSSEIWYTLRLGEMAEARRKEDATIDTGGQELVLHFCFWGILFVPFESFTFPMIVIGGPGGIKPGERDIGRGPSFAANNDRAKPQLPCLGRPIGFPPSFRIYIRSGRALLLSHIIVMCPTSTILFRNIGITKEMASIISHG